MDILEFALKLAGTLPTLWTFNLLLARYVGFFLVVPGLGMGERGLVVRFPAVLVLALVTTKISPLAELPPDLFMLAAQLGLEFILGFLVGLIPHLIVAGVQTAGQIATASMGLNAGNLIDPTLGVTTADIARILGDLTVILFLLVGGHHVLLYGLTGLAQEIKPGTFMPSEGVLNFLILHSSNIFEVGLMLSAPVMVALVLTNLVMGLISKVVPSVNIFIVSFPLTIGIGLILTVIALPDMVVLIYRELAGMEERVLEVVTLGK